MKKIIRLFAIVGLGFVLQSESCTSEENTTKDNSIPVQLAAIRPPFEEDNMNAQIQSFQLDPNEAKEVRLPNGTSVSIPADCFVDSEGKPLTKAVEIEYREFHTPAEIMASGIMMNYDSAGTKGFFESAGMFDIRAFSEGKSVNIAPEKTIQIKMASFAKGVFNSYYLNEDKKAWEYLTTTDPEKNKEKEEALDRLVPQSIRPIEPKAYREDTFVFDWKIDTSKFPELRDMEGVMWQHFGKDAAENPETNQWIFDENWGKVELRLKDANMSLYELNLESKSKKFKTSITPVLKGSKLKKAQEVFAQKMVAYEKALVQRQQEASRLKDQADLVRSFQVSRMGIHNFDRLFETNNRVACQAEFDFGKDINLNNNKVSVYLIPEGTEGSVVVAFEPSMWSEFWFPADRPCKLVAILPNHEVAVFTKEDFRRLDINEIKKSKKVSLKLKLFGRVTAMTDLKEALARI